MEGVMEWLIKEIRNIFTDRSKVEIDTLHTGSKINETIESVMSLNCDTERRIFYFPVVGLSVDIRVAYGFPMFLITCNKKIIKRSHLRKFTVKYDYNDQESSDNSRNTIYIDTNTDLTQAIESIDSVFPLTSNENEESYTLNPATKRDKIQYPTLSACKKSLTYPCNLSCNEYISRVITRLEKLKKEYAMTTVDKNKENIPKKNIVASMQDNWCDSMNAEFPVVGIDIELNIPMKHAVPILIRELGNPMNPKKCEDGIFLYHVHGMTSGNCEKTIKSLDKFDNFKNKIYPDEVNSTDLTSFWLSPYKFAISGWNKHARILVKINRKIIIIDPWGQYLHHKILDELTETNKHLEIMFLQRQIKDQTNEKSCVMCCIARLLSMIDNLNASFTETEMMHIVERPIDEFYAYLAVIAYRTKNLSIC
jgi:hypothetical protein